MTTITIWYNNVRTLNKRVASGHRKTGALRRRKLVMQILEGDQRLLVMVLHIFRVPLYNQVV